MSLTILNKKFILSAEAICAPNNVHILTNLARYLIHELKRLKKHSKSMLFSSNVIP